MITIKLGGDLADRFAPEITANISSVAEGIRCLRANFKGFASYLFEAANRGVSYEIQVGYELIEEHQLQCPIEKKIQSIRITPVIAGRGTIAKIIGGVALLGLGLAGVGFLGLSATTLAITGGALLFSGISALFSRQDHNSMIFNGSQTTTKEGNRVPIVYGLALVGLYLVSASITTSYYVN